LPTIRDSAISKRKIKKEIKRESRDPNMRLDLSSLFFRISGRSAMRRNKAQSHRTGHFPYQEENGEIPSVRIVPRVFSQRSFSSGQTREIRRSRRVRLPDCRQEFQTVQRQLLPASRSSRRDTPRSEEFPSRRH
jgi:hypothetical protein